MAKKTSGIESFAEDWMPIKSIMNGMIQIDGGYYVTGVKIEPKNIFIMDSGVQQNTIANLRNMYNAIDYEFWLIVADRPVDIGVYLSTLQIAYNNATSAITRKLIMEDINKANMFMSQEYNVVDTEYYILFKEKKMELIQKRLHNLISQLASCGLQSTQTSNTDLRVVLESFLNAGMNTEVKAVLPNER